MVGGQRAIHPGNGAPIRMMQTTLHIIEDCASLLDQAARIVGGLDDRVFATTTPISPRGSIAGHLRHILDFYENFLNGIETQRVDYNLRQRDPSRERDRFYAIARITRTIASLQQLTGIDQNAHLLISTEGSEGGSTNWCRSSVLRELEFLKSHTIHHSSLMAMLLRMHEIDPGEEFGVAPSTLGYWKEELACAR